MAEAIRITDPPGKANLKAPKQAIQITGAPSQPGVLDQLKGGTAAVGDFLSQIVSMPAAGISGLAAGAYEGLRSGSLDQGISAATEQIERVSKSVMPSTYMNVDPRTRELPDKALGYPGEIGGESMRGLVGLSKSIGHGSVNTGADYIRHPESDPLASAAADTAGMLAGYGGAHKAIVGTGRAITRPGEARLNLPEDSTTVTQGGPEAFRSKPPTSTEMRYSEYRTRKEQERLDKKKKPVKDQEKVVPDLALIEPEKVTGPELKEEFQPPGQRPLAPLMRNRRTGEKIDVLPQEPKADTGIDYDLPPDAKYGPTIAPVEKAQDGRALLEQSREDIQARERAVEEAKPDLDKPLEYDLTLEEQENVGAREREREDIYEGRKTFPTEDIPLKLEKAEQDTHLKNKVKELENLERKITEQERQAGQEAAEGSRVRQGEVDRSKVSKERTAETDRLIEETRKKRDKVADQVRARLTNRHAGIDIRVNLDADGRPSLSLYEAGEHLSEDAKPKLETPESQLFKTTMDSIEFTRDKLVREIERTTTPEMTRDPTVEEQPPVTKQGFVPKGQRGAINPEVFKEGFQKIKKIADKGIELTAKFVGFGKERPGTLQIMAKDEKGNIIGSTLFSPEDFRSLPINEKTDLFSLDTAVAAEWRDKGVPHEIYQFAAELGNDVVPSKARSKDGRKMWESFEKRGLSSQGKINRQRGAVDPMGIGAGLGKLLGKAKTAEQLRAELGYGDKEPAPKRSKAHKDALSSVLPSDPRDIPRFVEEESKNASEWQDIPDNAFKQLLNKVLQPNSVGALAHRFNPLIKYMSHQLDLIDAKTRVEKENALWGNQFKQGLRGWSKRIRSDDGARTILDTLPPAGADRVRAGIVHWMDGKELVEKGLDRPTPEMMRDRGMTDREIKAANAIYDQMDKAWEKVNALAEKLGQEPIKKRPGYFPSLWEGDYRIFVKNEDGKVVQTFGAATAREAKKIAADMQKKHPDYTISSVDASMNKYKMNDTNAFRLALDFLNPESAEAKILERTYRDVIAHRGFKTHGLEKKGAGGFLGSEEGIKGVKDFEKAIDLYFEKAYNFISEMEKRVALEDLKKGFAEKEYRIPTKLERTNEYLNEMVANSTGAIKNQLEIFDTILESAGRTTGFGSTAGRRAIGNLNGAAAVSWLTTPKFLGMQLVQPLFNIPKMMEITGKLDLSPANVVKAGARGYMESFVPGAASAESRAAMSWAKQNGMIDAKTLDLMGVNLNKSVWLKKLMGDIPKHTLGWWEQEMVRTPSFLAYNHLLKDAIPESKARWQAAAALTRKYMVEYSRTQSPSVYAKLGLVGEAARPLKQYSHAYAGQLSEYTALAAHDKQFAPLASFLGVQWTVAGVKGLVPLSVAALAISSLNKYANTDIPTPEEVLLGSGLSDLVTFGPLSTVTGVDLSGSLGMPDPTDIASLPGLEWGGKIAKEGIGLGSNYMQGLDTRANEMSFMQAAAPAIMQPFVEEAYTREGEGVPNPKNRMIPDLEPRTEEQKWTRRLSSGRPIEEASEKAKIRAFKAEGKRESEKRDRIMDKVINDLVYEGSLDDSLMDKWVEAGGNPKSWKESIKQHLVDRAMTFAERELTKSQGLSVAEKAERMQRFQMSIMKMESEDIASTIRELQ